MGLAVVNVLLIGRRPVPDRLGPAVGFVIVLVVPRRLHPQARAGPAAQPGGRQRRLRRGAVAIFLETFFHLTGMILILAAIGLFGLALCHDVLFVWPYPGDARVGPPATGAAVA